MQQSGPEKDLTHHTHTERQVKLLNYLLALFWVSLVRYFSLQETHNHAHHSAAPCWVGPITALPLLHGTKQRLCFRSGRFSPSSSSSICILKVCLVSQIRSLSRCCVSALDFHLGQKISSNTVHPMQGVGFVHLYQRTQTSSLGQVSEKWGQRSGLWLSQHEHSHYYTSRSNRVTKELWF